MVLYIGKEKFTPAIVSPQSGIVPAGTINIIENGLYNVTTYANAEVNINIPTPSKNVYTLKMIKDVENEIFYGAITDIGNATINILGDDSTLTPLRDNWEYHPANIEEIYQDILYSEHKFTEEKFTEVLGE